MADEQTTEVLEPLVLPEDLSGLSDEELEAAVAECTERSELLNTDKGLEGLDSPTAVALIENAVATGEALDAEQSKREEEKAEAEQILADTRARLAKRLNPDEDDDAAEADADDEDEDGDATAESDDDAEESDEDDEEDAPAVKRERVAAAAKPNRALRRRREHEPTQAQATGPRLMALADLPGEFTAGQNIDLKQAAKLIADRWNRSHGVDGPRMDMPLMRFAIDSPPERTLEDGDDVGNWEKIQNVVGPEALVAAGGICAPPEPYYDFQILSGAHTPVVDSIPRFGSGAGRGGISWSTPATLAAITTGVGQITEADDSLGGTNSAKTCQRIECPETQTAFVDAVYHCLTFGNMGARTWPELVKHFTALTMAAHARLRETKALDALKAGSTQVTQAAVGGASNTLLGGILQAAEAMRNRHRMADSAVLRAWFPQWVLGLLAEDLLRKPYDHQEVLDAGGYKSFVTQRLRACQIAPTFYVDTETGGGMAFGTQAAAALTPFPSTTKWFLAPEGTWVRLDGGSLDLGLVRDSVLNAQNDFQMFGEVFETYAKVGIESIEVTTTMAGSGVTTAPA